MNKENYHIFDGKIYILDDFVPNKNDCSAILKLNRVRR